MGFLNQIYEFCLVLLTYMDCYSLLQMPYFNLQKLSSSLKPALQFRCSSGSVPALRIRVLAHPQPCLDIKSSQDSWLELEHIQVISCYRSISHLQEVCICQQQCLSSPSVIAEPETRTSSPHRSRCQQKNVSLFQSRTSTEVSNSVHKQLGFVPVFCKNVSDKKIF